MRLAIVSDSFERVAGGIEYQAMRLASGLGQLGHSVSILSPSKVFAPFESEYDWVILEGIRRMTLLAWLALWKKRPRARYWLAPHGSFFPYAHHEELARVGFVDRSPVVIARLGFDVALMRRILSSMSVVSVLSEIEAEDIHQVFGLDRGKMHVLPHLIPNFGNRSQSPSPTQPPEQRPYFLTVSRLERRKNVASAIKAAQVANQELVIIGADGGERAEIQRLTSSTNGRVRYLGRVSEEEKHKLIMGSVAVVIPSFFDGLPVVSLEARALGVRVICTRLSYAPKLEGVSLCDPTPSGIAACMRQAIDGGPLAHQSAIPGEAEALRSYVELLERPFDLPPPAH